MKPWQNLGINFSNDINYTISQYNREKITSDLDELKSKGINNIRIVSNLSRLGAGGVQSIRYAAQHAKERDFFVLFGCTWDAPTLTSSNLSTYESLLLNEAQFAQDNFMDNFMIGNEMESFNDNTTLTDVQLRLYLKNTVASLVKQIYTRGQVTYSVAQDWQENNWIGDNDRGNIDRLDLNVYGDANNFGAFKTYLDNFLAKYPDAHVTEWAMDSNWFDYAFYSDTKQMLEFYKRLEYLKLKNVQKAYYFTWRWANSNYFATKTTANAYRSWWTLLCSDDKVPYSNDLNSKNNKSLGGSIDTASGGNITLGTKNIFSSSFTFMAWMKWNGANGSYQSIFHKRDAYNVNKMMFCLSLDTTGKFILDTTKHYRQFGVAPPIGVPFHVAWVRDASIPSDILFINGMYVADQPAATMANKTDALITVGGSQNPSSDPFNGLFYDVCVARRALSWEEIQKAANKFIYPSNADIFTHMRLDEGRGTRLVDISGNENAGIVNGSAWIGTLTKRLSTLHTKNNASLYTKNKTQIYRKR